MQNRKNLKIVFMGTPDFAVPVLRVLAENYTVVGVVTKADRPKGRGNVMTSPPVKLVANELGIPALQPETVKTQEFIDDLTSFGADLFVTAAYGKILPEAVLNIPPMGCINVHASLLPLYRGSAPIWRCVLDGAAETGITTMFTDVGMDTGDILLKRTVDIPENMTTGELHDILSDAGCDTIVKTIDGILSGNIYPVPQEHEKATYAPPIEKEECLIDWNKPSFTVHNLIRGMDPFPGAYSFLNGKRVKLFGARKTTAEARNAIPGTILGASERDGESALCIACKSGAVEVTRLQEEGARAMSVGQYLAGHSIPEGTVFGK